MYSRVVFAYASKISNVLSEYGWSGEGMQALNFEGSGGPYIFRSYDHWGANPLVPFERNPGAAHSVAIWVSHMVNSRSAACPIWRQVVSTSTQPFLMGFK